MLHMHHYITLIQQINANNYLESAVLRADGPFSPFFVIPDYPRVLWQNAACI